MIVLSGSLEALFWGCIHSLRALLLLLPPCSIMSLDRSTVTYLTDCGAPTFVLDRRNPPRPLDVAIAYGPVRRGLLSCPRVGKHIVFDGQFD